MRDNDELKAIINKKDPFYIMNTPVDQDADEFLQN
jgi:hypothetical protein